MTAGQQDFRLAVLDPVRPRPDGLVDGTRAPAGRRFDVYRNNVAVSLSDALETAFPVLRKLLGERNFRTLAGVFLRQHPPSSPLMMFYGSEMPGFLRTFQPTSAMGYLPDIARLELAMRESYHAADDDPVDPERLKSMPTEALMASRIGLAACVRLVRSNWPIHTIWRYNTEENAPKPQMERQDVIVVRPEFDPLPHLLPAGGGEFVEALLKNQCFGEAHEAAAVTTPEFDLAATLGLLIAAGAITRIGD